MSDDEADPELLALLRQSLGLGPASSSAPPTTGVLKDAQYICDNSIDVAISPPGTKVAAKLIWTMMQERKYSTASWTDNELHPKTKDESTINFIFTMNLLNFSFWSELPSEERFAVEYKGQRWTGYWSLIAALQKALDEGYPITSPSFWIDISACPDSLFEHIFRSATNEQMPLLPERIAILREAGEILEANYDSRPLNLINEANESAAVLVNLLVEYFPNFQDSSLFHNKKVRLYKRAQIMVADLWACFNSKPPCHFHDINHLTTFPDYRIPQMLHSLGVLLYSPRLESMIRNHVQINSGSVEEVEIRGCSVWAVEMLRREIEKLFPRAAGEGHPNEFVGSDEPRNEEHTNEQETFNDPDVQDRTSEGHVEKEEVGGERGEGMADINAVLIDFFLYDCTKEKEAQGKEGEMLPHHRTRSIYY